MAANHKIYPDSLFYNRGRVVLVLRVMDVGGLAGVRDDASAGRVALEVKEAEQRNRHIERRDRSRRRSPDPAREHVLLSFRGLGGRGQQRCSRTRRSTRRDHRRSLQPTGKRTGHLFRGNPDPGCLRVRAGGAWWRLPQMPRTPPSRRSTARPDGTGRPTGRGSSRPRCPSRGVTSSQTDGPAGHS